MASKSGPISAGADGHDFMHRQRIAEQYFIRYGVISYFIELLHDIILFRQIFVEFTKIVSL